MNLIGLGLVGFSAILLLALYINQTKDLRRSGAPFPRWRSYRAW